MNVTLESLRGKLIVSCQAYPGEPMRDPGTMRRIAESVLLGGAAGVRVQGLEDLKAIRAVTDVPLIGLLKDGHDGVFITPTAKHARAVATAGADIVAMDGTRRVRPDQRQLSESIQAVHQQGALVLADVSTVDEGVCAAELGADLIGSTLSGYTEYTTKTEGPDLALVEKLAAVVEVPVLAEGRIHTPRQAAAALRQGAFAVVVGTAITHPATITRWFAGAMADVAETGAIEPQQDSEH